MIVPAQFPVFAFRERASEPEPGNAVKRGYPANRDEMLGVVVAWQITEKLPRNAADADLFAAYPLASAALLASGETVYLPDTRVQFRTASTR